MVENAVRTIDHNEGETTIDSLVLEERLLISGGSLTTGELEMLPGGQLISLGQFSATGATSAESISLTAGQSNVGSGTISLPNLTDFGTENQIGWSSCESESLIDLPALTNISGPSASFRVFSITAARGGEINLNSVTAIASRNDTSVVKITAENDGSG